MVTRGALAEGTGEGVTAGAAGRVDGVGVGLAEGAAPRLLAAALGAGGWGCGLTADAGWATGAAGSAAVSGGAVMPMKPHPPTVNAALKVRMAALAGFLVMARPPPAAATAATGVVVAAPSPPASEVVRHRLDGRLARGCQPWVGRLGRLHAGIRRHPPN